MERNKLMKLFAQYVAFRGYKAIRVRCNETGLYAHIKGHASYSTTIPYFSQVLQGGTVLRLSLKDLDNTFIVGDFFNEYFK